MELFLSKVHRIFKWQIKGGLISEGIFTLVPFSKNVRNYSTVQTEGKILW